ncbi:hypothetical protein NT6N_05020 [Oceaniferula spumae]|uniref:FecR protein domain-containing protein n=1 Tax=Oceaniferula spumae TaxID=2979115 RepID=A0AAT9FHK2_9BACT
MNQPLESRIQAMLDGTITETEFHHLEDELAANPEARQIYYEYAALHQGLEFRLSRASKTASGLGLAESRLLRQRSRSRRVALISAAALVLISLITMRLFFTPEVVVDDSLSFETAPGTLFTLTHNEANENPKAMQMDIESRLQISQGTVELNFASGVSAIIQGPADITLHDHDRLYMGFGTGWFNVPQKAIGFTVVTRELNIVDLGTEFGVISDPGKDDEVHVFKGKVRVEALHGVKKETTLTANQAVLVRPYGRFQVVDNNPPVFQKTLPKTLPHMHWSFDSRDDLLASNTIITAANLHHQLHSSSKPSQADLTSGPFGKALALDGISNYLETDWAGILGDRPRTVAFWLKMPNRRAPELMPHQQHTVVGWGTQQSGHSSNLSINSKWTIHFDYAENKPPILNMSYGGFWYYTRETELDDNAWHHVAVTYSGESDHAGNPVTRLFIDGQAHKIHPASHPPVRTHEDGQVMIDTMEKTPLVIGATLSREGQELIAPNQFLQAKIDELYIIEGVINEDSIRQLMTKNQLTH